MMILNQLPVYILLSFVIALGIVFYLRKSITASGFFALVAISYVFIITNHMEFWLIIVGMFLSSTLISKLGHEQKIQFAELHERVGARNYVQALANFGPAVLFFVVWYYTSIFEFQIAFVAGIAAANADTWASEIGMLSNRRPVHIFTLKPIPTGISGGVTLVGSIAGVLGSIFIAILTYYAFNYSSIMDTIWIFTQTSLFIVIVLAGIIGFMIDSMLGASIQILYKTKEDKLSEKKAESTEVIKGISWIDNDVVNFISCLFAGIISIILHALFTIYV